MLVGFPGSGKTTIGKKLANFLHLEFRDLDVEIEENSELDKDELNVLITKVKLKKTLYFTTKNITLPYLANTLAR